MVTTPAAQDTDDLHRPTSSSPWITETAWYSFWTRGGEFAVHAYLRFRVNAGVADSSVYAWRAGVAAHSPWEAVYWKQVPESIPPSLRDVSFLGGLHHLQKISFEHHELSYRDETVHGAAFGFRVQFHALQTPQYFGRRHFDQEMRATGVLEVDGGTYDVDCLCMRDRSWYRRSDFDLFRSAYSYCITDDDTWLALFAVPKDDPPNMLTDVLPLVGGYRRRGGQCIPLVSGQRRVRERDAASGAPVVVDIEATDELDNRAVAIGRRIGSVAVAANTSMLSWMTLTEWEVTDWSGGSRVIRHIGEDQDIWSPSIWRAFRSGAS